MLGQKKSLPLEDTGLMMCYVVRAITLQWKTKETRTKPCYSAILGTTNHT
jgi:hypothetical protein